MRLIGCNANPLAVGGVNFGRQGDSHRFCADPRVAMHAVRIGIGGLPVAVLLVLSGCVAPPNGAKLQETRNEALPAAPIVKPVEPEENQSQSQEALAAVEEFLSRTQEYRLPVRDERPAVTAVPASTIAVAPQPQPIPPPAPTPAATVPRDAALANTQISVGDHAATPAPQAIPALESIAIRSSMPRAVAATPSPQKLTNGPLELQTGDSHDSIETHIASLRDDLKTKQDMSAEWKLRMLLAALDRDVEAGGVADHAPSELKGILPAWSAASAAIRAYTRNPAQGAESAVERLENLRGLLVGSLEPRVRSVALCRKVSTYGSYEEMSPDEFVSGRSIQTIVYAEIENLRAASEASDAFETKLSTRLEVLTTDGKSMWQREEPEVVDRCRRPRRDFFVAQRITFPPTLPVGDYVLKFSVEDKGSGMLAESAVPFSLKSPISVAKGQ